MTEVTEQTEPIPQGGAAAPMTATEVIASLQAGPSTGAGEQTAESLELASVVRVTATLTASVSALQQEVAALKAATPAPAATPTPSPAPKPSPGRIVIFRDGTGNEYPAMVTRVYPKTGAVGLFVFRDDAPGTHSFGGQLQIDPESEGAIGWFWPPRA